MLRKQSFWLNIIKQSSWYYLCSALNNGLAILLLPFLSRQLSTDEYGVIQLSTGIGLFLPMIFSFGIDKAIYRYYNSCNSLHEKRQLLSTVYWFVVVSGIIFLTLFVISSPLWFKSVVHLSPNPYIWLFVYPYLFAQISVIGQSYFQQTFDLRRMTVIEVFGTTINLSLSIYFVLTWEDGAMARLSAIAIAFLLKSAMYTYFLVKRNLLIFVCDYHKVIEYVRFSLPLLPNSITLWISRTFDRILISYYCGTAIAGVYSTATQVSFVLYFIQDSIVQALGPMQIRSLILDKTEALNRLNVMSKMFYIIMIVFVLLLSAFCSELMNIILNKNFIPPVILIVLLSSIYVYQTQYRLFSDIIVFHKKNKYFMYAGIVQAVVSLAINILLIPIYGYIVAGYSGLISILLYTLIIVYFSQKLERIELDCMFYIKYTTLSVLIILIMMNLSTDKYMLMISLKLLMLSGILILGIKDILKLKRTIN